MNDGRALRGKERFDVVVAAIEIIRAKAQSGGYNGQDSIPTNDLKDMVRQIEEVLGSGGEGAR